MPDLTPDEVTSLLLAGARHAGWNPTHAAIHLITFTELIHMSGFQRHIKIEDVQPFGEESSFRAAFVQWASLLDSREAKYLGGGDSRLLKLAHAFATGTPVDPRDVVGSLGHAHARRITEAMLLATGYGRWFTLEPTEKLTTYLAEQDALIGGPDA